jgi:peptidoglycan/xylan/chitin deacetylase (PgdA/CDA1 family)
MYNPQGFQKYGAHLIPPAVIFHLVDPDIHNRLCIAPDDFDHFLDTMERVGLQPVSMQTYWNMLNGKDKRKIEESYLLTFDDAYDCFNRYALPIIQKHQAESTIFIPTAYIGQWNTWNPKIPFNAKHMTWNDIHQAAEAGVEIGSHGCSHRSFQKLILPEIENELFHSKQILKEKTGQSVNCFAYPYGDSFPQSNYIVSKVYDTAVSVEEGGRVWPEDQYHIKRYDYQALIHMVTADGFNR